jgi:hypothetical protein
MIWNNQSTILNETDKSQLYSWFNGKVSKLTLLLRGSVDGFSKEMFHFKCDNYEHTLVIVKSTSGNVFGGYASVSWNSVS